MRKFLCFFTGLSAAFIPFTANIAWGETPSINFVYPIVANADIGEPVCYMKIRDGRILDLSSICGKSREKEAIQPVNCPDISDDRRRFVFARFYGNDYQSLANLGCKEPPPPLFLPENGSTPG